VPQPSAAEELEVALVLLAKCRKEAERLRIELRLASFTLCPHTCGSGPEPKEHSLACQHRRFLVEGK
jgi:hypothetical protein